MFTCETRINKDNFVKNVIKQLFGVVLDGLGPCWNTSLSSWEHLIYKKLSEI